jgi:HK97 family phage major capsid protein
VPDPLAANVIDLARAKSILVNAGAKTVPMTSSTLTIARQTADATMEVKAENASFTGYDVTFDAIGLTAYTIGTVVEISRELAADAANAVSIIESSIAKALAAQIDYYGLRGTGSAQPTGLINWSGTNTVNVGGSVDYADIFNGIEYIEVDNHSPNALVFSPANWNVLRSLLINSEANHYCPMPPEVAALYRGSTSAMPDTDGILGDFTKYIIGLRQPVEVEVTREGGDSFKKHQVLVKVTWRGDFNCEDREAFCLLQSIS